MNDIIDDMKVKINNETQKARSHIERAIEQNGPYSHNMISITLAFLADKCGKKYANELVDEFDLKELYGIERETE